MKKIILFLPTFLLLCSCGAAGRLTGTVARLPVDLARATVGRYDQDKQEVYNIPSENPYQDAVPLSSAQ